MDNKFVCLHGHFYQPPRENPWLEELEREPSTAPYHDWNERVFHECYGPNSASAVLGPSGRIEELVNNYRLISFDFGPTLLSWLEREHPETYAAVLAADRASAGERDGHGNALAQAYNHTILPLASRRDKLTQVRWGLADFRHRFGREAEGLWLPETAVDGETLEVLAEEGVRFTVLAPGQAARVRPAGGGEADWRPVAAGGLDTTRPYRWASRERPGRSVAIFFYDGGIAHDVAFGGLLGDGAAFARRLLGAVRPGSSAQLVHVATDGESYGHHHRHGEMCLSFALRSLARETPVRLANYGQFLDLFPPPEEVEVRQRSSWSCAHGVERWTSDCGCRTGGPPAWRQGWRKPLREALDHLASSLDELFAGRAGRLFRDPWAARDAYVARILDPRSSPAPFLESMAGRALSPEETREALALCELQRHRQLMFTSCGWFFNDLAGLETAQILRYAARAIGLAAGLGTDLEPGFRDRLGRSEGNDPAFPTGAEVYDRLVAPHRFDAERAAAEEAILGHVEAPARRSGAYSLARRALERFDTRDSLGHRSLSVQHLEVSHGRTAESGELTAVVHHRGRLDFECWVKAGTAEDCRRLSRSLGPAFGDQEHEFRSVAERLLGADYRSVEAVSADRRRELLLSLAPAPTPEAGESARSWRRILARLEADPGALRDAFRGLAAEAEGGKAAGEAPGAGLLRRTLAREFWSYAAGSGARAPELEGLLRAARAAGLGLEEWELRAAVWRRRDSPDPGYESLAAALDFAVAAVIPGV